jgi:4-aminobutyrate aminotransferase-like enzyme
MTNPDLTKSLQLWKEYGQFVLMAMPYDDNVIVAANGCTVVDADGNEFLDLTSGQFCAVLGHNHPKLKRSCTPAATRCRLR